MKNFTLCFLIFCSFSVYSQLTVSTAQNPAQLVQDVLIGDGVTPTNILFNGISPVTGYDQVGHFVTNFNQTNLGIAEGLIMSTGQTIDAPGPNNETGHSSTGDIVNPSSLTTGDADLDLLTANTITNVAILEFDFVATGLELNFDYVFASEEYPEYVYTVFNDVFGFFLSGPGITGPFSNNAKNIALVPGTTTPITINTINNGYNNSGSLPLNENQYVNNTTIGQNPVTGSGPTVQYDGFTKVLRATSALECGETYHIKLALSNCGDTSFDSAIFLQNFRIKPIEILANGYNSANNPDFKLCQGAPIALTTGITTPGVVFVWTYNTNVIPGETQSTLNLPIGAPAGDYDVTVTTAGGCILGGAAFTLEYYPDPLGNPVDLNLCTTASAPYPFGDIRQTAALLQGTNPLYYDIRYFYTEAEAQALVPGAGISQAELSNYFLNGTTIDIFVRLEEQVDTACITVKKFTLTAGPQPTGTFSYPSSPFCNLLTTGAVQTTVTPGGVYTSSSSLLIIDPNTGEIDITASTAGNYTVNYHLPASGTCPDFDVINIPVTITAAPAAPTITPIQDFCQGVAASLTPTGETGATFLWYTTATGGTGSATAPANITANPGQTIYYVSQNNGCEGPRASVEVNIFAAPVAPVTTNLVFCEDDLTAVPLTTDAAETNLLWYTTLTGGTGSAVAPTPDTSITGTTIFYVTQTVNLCESPRAALEVLVNPLPAAPALSSATLGFCENEIVQANSLSTLVTGTNLQWYSTLTGGTGSATEPTISTLASGVTPYYVSQTVNGCEGPRSLITVTVTALPGAPAFTPPAASYCQGEIASLTVTPDPGATLLWYAAATGGVGSTTAPDITLNAGPATYYVSQVTNCESPRAAISVLVNPIPVAPQTASISYCQNATTAVPLTTAGGETNLLWYADNLATTTGNTTAPTPNTATAGVFNYYVTQTVGGCESLRAALEVTIYALPAAPALSSATLGFCENEIVPANALSTLVTGTNLQWYSTLTGGTGSATEPTISTLASAVTPYYVSQTVNGCEGPRSLITVTVTPLPGAPAFTPPAASYCQGEIASLTVTPDPGATLLWYAAATGGVGSTTAPDITLNAGPATYYVSQVTNCESPRAAISVLVNPIPVAPQTASISYCQNATTAVPLTTSGGETNLLWYADNLPTTTGNTTAPTPNTATAGVFNYYVTQTVGGCESLRAALEVTIYALPAAPALSSATLGFCENEIVPANALSTLVTGTNLQWYSTLTGGTGSATEPTISTLASAVTPYYVSQTVNGCEGPRSLITVTVTPLPGAPAFTPPAASYCQGEIASLTVTPDPGATLLWYAAATGGVGSTTAPDITLNAGPATYYVSQVTNCESPRAAISVLVNPIPVAPQTASISYCQNATTAVPLTTAGGETNLLWYADNLATTTGNTTAPTPNTATAGVFNYYVTQTVGGCESLRAAVQVTIYATPGLPQTAALSYCENDTAAVLSATPDVGGTLIWYTSLTSLGQSTPPIVDTSITGPTTVYVSQSINGCEGNKASIVITVNPLPTAPTFTTIQPTCTTNTAEIHFTPGANLEYSINNGSTFQSSPDFLTVGAGATYTLIVRNLLTGCISPSVQTIVNPAFLIPAAPVAISITQPTCITPTGTIEVVSAGSGFAYSLNGGATSQSGTIFSLLAPNATYSIIVINSVTGCKSLPAQFTVNPIPANPVIPVATVTQPICTVPTGTISVPSTAGLEYSVDGITFQNSGTFTLLAPNTTYFITVRNTLTGCVSTSPGYVINPAPTFPAMPIITGSDVCEGETIILTTPAVTGATYAWTGPDGFTATTQNISIPNADFAMSGDYKLIIETGLNCPSPQGVFNVVVNEIVEPTLPQDGYICFDPVTNIGEIYTLETGLSDMTYDFNWYEYTSGTAVLIPGAVGNTFNVTVPGLYGVSAMNALTMCQSPIVTANVGSSSPPQDISLLSSNFFADEQQITVTVSPVGAYEYQLDNGAWQSSNIFTDVASGERTVRVRNECGEISETANLLTFAKFFTPNADSYNDEWNIFELCGQPNAKIYIFDRYGKLLKEISPCGSGWNGTINSQPVPATDYWFIVHYQENNIDKIFKSHFALKR